MWKRVYQEQLLKSNHAKKKKKEDLYVAWLIDTWHDASTFEMTHSNVDTHEARASACESMNPKVTPQIDFVFPQR